MDYLIYIFPPLGNWLLFSLFYLFARLKDDYSVIDIAWGLSFINIALNVLLAHSFNASNLGWSHYTILILVIAWALRLSAYILYRNLKKGEDARYSAWREDWGESAPVNFYFRVYCVQAGLSLLVGVGLWITLAKVDLPWSHWSTMGTLVSTLGLLYETIADWQKDRFKKEPKNQGFPCRQGLWYYSRHPNYFGEMIFWSGLFFFSLPYTISFFTWLGPFFITFFLIKLSGLPMLTESYKKQPNYAEYLRTTNALIPSRPRK